MGWDINCHGGLDGKGGNAALPRAPTGKRQGKGPAAADLRRVALQGTGALPAIGG